MIQKVPAFGLPLAGRLPTGFFQQNPNRGRDRLQDHVGIVPRTDTECRNSPRNDNRQWTGTPPTPYRSQTGGLGEGVTSAAHPGRESSCGSSSGPWTSAETWRLQENDRMSAFASRSNRSGKPSGIHWTIYRRATAPEVSAIFCGLQGLTLSPSACTIAADDVNSNFCRHRLWRASDQEYE